MQHFPLVNRINSEGKNIYGFLKQCWYI